ncbi:hypothetical protein PoB_000278600 [Plakobranchus ocellatus]|uniref:Uncharacterized protein n=1 Tax=Plakobranchus ocellatus TaxID=259542 RepID=A0AAV3XDS3_9GAST|nr:hypothetical protein PoB_000278600 [Plakobranchus ocellatus]
MAPQTQTHKCPATAVLTRLCGFFRPLYLAFIPWWSPDFLYPLPSVVASSTTSPSALWVSSLGSRSSPHICLKAPALRTGKRKPTEETSHINSANPQQGDLRFSVPPSGQGVSAVCILSDGTSSHLTLLELLDLWGKLCTLGSSSRSRTTAATTTATATSTTAAVIRNNNGKTDSNINNSNSNNNYNYNSNNNNNNGSSNSNNPNSSN